MNLIWREKAIIDWSQIILNSYQQLLKKDLIKRDLEPLIQAQNLFNAPFVVFSHNTNVDPLYNYGNQQGLDLWEMSWSELMLTPSRTTTQPLLREERELLLQETTTKGYIENYQGIRISKKGTRYQIDDITVWNLYDQTVQYCGQAATFSQWTVIN